MVQSFCDEIGDIPPETQVRLLRVIQEREFTPLGDTTPRRVDVRIIAATNIDLQKSAPGSFREDLYYRLAVVPIELPPLRDRREHICLGPTLHTKVQRRERSERFGANRARGARVAGSVFVARQRARTRKLHRACGCDRAG